MSFSRLLLRLALGRRLPITFGERHVRGPTAPITIRRDKFAVPHITAENEPDAYFAIGFCQGQDRAGQLEVMWRLVRGRLAEWVGTEALVADRVSRRIGFRRAAEAQVATLAPEVRAAFEAFAAGLTVGTTAGLPRKPHEFAIVGGQPSAWDAADVLGLIKLQSFLLPSNWDVELARLRILLADGAGAVEALDPSGEALSREPKASAAPSALAFGSQLTQLTSDIAALQAYLPRGGGSNNWVIAGSRTVSGKPILASDPHLAPSCPPPWYLVHVRTPQWEVAGAALAGAPGIAIGHNGFAAWGVTAGLTDNSDFFIETLGPDGKSVRQPDGTFLPCEVVKEVIPVKGAPDAVEEVLVTPRGPILTPLVPELPFALSLSAIWLDARPLVGYFGAPTARSFDEFRHHFAAWPALPLNMLYADVDGTIGWQLIGELPTRRGGYGLLPRPADLPDSGWSGTVPFEQMPSVANPEPGYFATANDDVRQWAEAKTPPPGELSLPSPLAGEGGESSSRVRGETDTNTEDSSARSDSLAHPSPGGEAPPPSPARGEGEDKNTSLPFRQGGLGEEGSSRAWLGADYIDDYRARRIREQLAARDSGWTLAECSALQLDVQSIPWREMRDRVLTLKPMDPDAGEALKLLTAWDGRVDTESPAAAVFELFVAEMCVRVAKAKAPNAWRSAIGEGGLGVIPYNLFLDRRVAHLSRLLREQPLGWFASWNAEMESALALAVRTLRRNVGPAPGFWAWGHTRQLRLEHPLFGKHRWLGPVFNRGPIPWGGDANTVSQAAAPPGDPTAYTHNIANMRCVFDLADLSRSTFVLCGGQSGNPLSPHHADQFPLWQRGESFAMPWDQAEVICAAVDVLRLTPE